MLAIVTASCEVLYGKGTLGENHRQTGSFVSYLVIAWRSPGAILWHLHDIFRTLVEIKAQAVANGAPRKIPCLDLLSFSS
jgi:hypothetical protein